MISIKDWAGQTLLLSMYYALIESHLTYGILCWGHNIGSVRATRLLRMQKWALRIIFKKKRTDSCRELFAQSGVMTFPNLYIFHACLETHNRVQNSLIQSNFDIHCRNLRSANDVHLNHCKTKTAQNFITTAGKTFFNKLPEEMKSIACPKVFKRKIKDHFIRFPCYTFDEFLNPQ